MVTAAMMYLKARKMERHPRLMDPELAAILRNNGKGAQHQRRCRVLTLARADATAPVTCLCASRAGHARCVWAAAAGSHSVTEYTCQMPLASQRSACPPHVCYMACCVRQSYVCVYASMGLCTRSSQMGGNTRHSRHCAPSRSCSPAGLAPARWRVRS